MLLQITHMVPAQGYGCQHMRYGDEEEEQPKLTSCYHHKTWKG